MEHRGLDTLETPLAFFISTVAALLGCSSEPSAGVHVDLIGKPAPILITVDKGSCSAIKHVDSKGLTIELSNSECVVPQGQRTFSVKCANNGLPSAKLTLDIPQRSSHYVQFNELCSSSSEAIEAGNRATRVPAGIWKPTAAQGTPSVAR
jgi:hypothetical protein